MSEHGDGVFHRHVLEHVLEEDGLCHLISDGQGSTEIPLHVGPGPDQVDIDPSIEVVATRAQVETELRPSPEDTGPSTSSAGERIGCHLLCPKAHGRAHQ
jgi:hypothetical protein